MAEYISFQAKTKQRIAKLEKVEIEEDEN